MNVCVFGVASELPGLYCVMCVRASESVDAADVELCFPIIAFQISAQFHRSIHAESQLLDIIYHIQ